MAPNKHRWHLLIISEDEATRQLSNGLASTYASLCPAVQTLPKCKGWTDTIKRLKETKLDQFIERRILIFIDFDKDTDRFEKIKNDDYVKRFDDRIFIVGTFTEVEDLKNEFNKSLREINKSESIGKFEAIGKLLGKNCDLWKNKYLHRSSEEICKLRNDIIKNNIELI